MEKPLKDLCVSVDKKNDGAVLNDYLLFHVSYIVESAVKAVVLSNHQSISVERQMTVTLC